MSAADAFLDHFGVSTSGNVRHLVGELGGAFARLPYENLTKLIKKVSAQGEGRRRQPHEVVADHLEWGTGGTCFALTELFGEVVARFDISSRPVLCDTPHRPRNHCGLLVAIDGEPRLIDPAYLLHEPIALRTHAPSPHVKIEQLDERRFAVSTYGRQRYVVDTRELSREDLLQTWDASFEWTMMRNIHVCAPSGSGYSYVHGHKLRRQQAASKSNANLRGCEADALCELFGIDPAITRRAYEIVEGARG